MPTIQEDHEGLWINAGGYVARPFGIETQFKAGDQVKTKHFSRSCKAGIGKLSGRGKYQEYWCTTGIMSSEYKARQIYDTYARNYISLSEIDSYVTTTTKWYKDRFKANVKAWNNKL